MLIDMTDIKVYEAKQWTYEFTPHDISNSSEWVTGALSPVFLRNEIGFKKLKLTLMVYGGGRENIQEKCGSMLSRLLEPVTLTLDNRNKKFYGVLQKHSINELSKDRFHQLTLEFDGYEYGEIKIVSQERPTSLEVLNPGNLTTPAIIEIFPTIGYTDLKITGVVQDTLGTDKPITIQRLTNGAKIILNGETCTVTENEKNKFIDVELYDFPRLKPGKNTLTFSQPNINVAIKFKPRYF